MRKAATPEPPDSSVRGHLELLVLASLSATPSHGYALIESLQQGAGWITSARVKRERSRDHAVAGVTVAPIVMQRLDRRHSAIRTR
jgi:hypothetical protein